MSRRFCLGASLGATLMAAVALAQAPPPVAAIRNARIITGNGTVVARGSVVIRHGLIADVGENATIPPEAWILPGEGLTVYPGLIEGLGTLGIPENRPAAGAPARPPSPPQRPAQGPEDRPLTNSWVRAADLVNLTDTRLSAARAKGYTTAATFPASGIFTGQGAFINLGGETPGRMVVQPGIGQQITLARSGFNAFPASLMGTIAYVRQVFLDAGHYRMAKEQYAKNAAGLERPSYDRALEGVLESQRFLLPAVSAVEIDRMLRFSKELGRPTILYGVLEGYNAVSLLKGANVPVLVSLRWPEAARERDPDDIESMRNLELRENAPSTPAALAKAGVKFGFYSDRAEDPFRSLRRAIEKGLTQEEALRAMSLSIAEIYGVADRLGSIDKGKIANLVITRGDLFVEKPQIEYLFIDGVRHEPPPPAAPAKSEATQ